MNHRERVITSLNHEAPDRCPMQISFTPEFAERLSEDLLAKDIKEYNPHGGGNTYELERALDEDMLLTSVGWVNSYYQEGDYYIDEWGVGWRSIEYETKFGKGRYTEPVDHPLDKDSSIDSYKAPDPTRPELYKDAEWLLKTYKNEYYIVGVVVTTIFECAWALRGLDKLMMDFINNPELAERILDIPYKYHLEVAKRLTKMGVDMIWTGDDMGGQVNMLISPEYWRKFFKPRMANFYSELKQINPDLKIAYHTDGFIDPIIPELIEIGLDVLNPVQPPCVDIEKVKRLYGDKLCFWGSIDEQHTLPFGTPEDVKNEVINRINILGKNGGFIIGPTHNVQLDTPLENFWAMVNTIKNTSCK